MKSSHHIYKTEITDARGLAGSVCLSVVPAVLMVVGILGMVFTLLGLLYGLLVAKGADLTYLLVMLAGALLCAVFAGLLFQGYRNV